MFCNLFHIIKGVSLNPLILAPDFNTASHTYQYCVFLNSGKLPEDGRKKDSSLLVYFTGGSACQEET